MVHEMRRRGIRVDQSAAEQARDYCLQKRDAVLAELSEQLGTHVGVHEIASPKWLARTLTPTAFSYPRTAKGNPSFKAGKPDGWWGIRTGLPRLIATASKYEHAGSTFLEGHILGRLIGGRIYGEINPHRSEEGGTKLVPVLVLKSTAPADAVARPGAGAADSECVPAGRGRVWCRPISRSRNFDSSSITPHSAISAKAAKEAAELYRLDPDTDVHQLVATWTGFDRKSAKGVNFGRLPAWACTRSRRRSARRKTRRSAIYANGTIWSCHL